MEVYALLFGLLCLSVTSLAKDAPPKVQIYSRTPGMMGKSNTLICHANGFHPPEIRIDLLENDQEMAGTKQSDLAFEDDWNYHLTKHAPFTPSTGVRYSCKVTHMGNTKTYIWDPDM